ncbi:NAD(P)/FAD-dependent oxidoreductase, partial [Patescibacteria group bacterium]|nr:NAD(P)/FAD-dependent oxidoreductase [Patescibacteria group bacterium]
MAKRECDLIIVGGGPAGLSAAINGASEGLNIILIDSGPALGGQAAKSSLIENYPGFPKGITGPDLVGNWIEQAGKFKTVMECPQTALGLRADGDRKIVVTDDDEIVGKMVILSAGLSYRRLAAPGVSTLMGRGVLYGAPTFDPRSMGDCKICIVGGANSAGQAAMHMSMNPSAQVQLLIRKRLEDQMSTYLVERVRAAENITVCEGVEVIEACGAQSL